MSGLKVESDTPALNAAFVGLASEKLRDLANQNGANFAGVYGQPLVVNQPRSQTVMVDATGPLSGLLGAFASQAEVLELFGQIESMPLRHTTVTTYGGLNAQGLQTFVQTSRYDRRKMNVRGGTDLP